MYKLAGYLLLMLASFPRFLYADDIRIDAFSAEKIATAFHKGYEEARLIYRGEVAARHSANYESVAVMRLASGSWKVSIPRLESVTPCCYEYLVSETTGEVTFVPGK